MEFLGRCNDCRGGGISGSSKDGLSGTGGNMAERLGHVLGWTGDILGFLLALGGLWLVTQSPPGSGDIGSGWIIVAVAALVFLIGRACRYILAGTSKS